MIIASDINRVAVQAAFCALTLPFLAGAQAPPQPTEPDYGDYPDQIVFPLTQDQLPSGLTLPTISSTLPTGLASFTPTTPTNAQQTLFQVQQAFDVFAWQTFIALNWPADPQLFGIPSASNKIGTDNAADRVWESFMPPREIFRKNGAAPAPYVLPMGVRENDLNTISKKTHLLNEMDEAFFNLEKPLPPILDTNNEYVRYEIRINETEYEYIVDGPELNGTNYPLYSLAKQKAFIDAGGTITFPDGCIELKVGWKKMGKGDDPSRFFTQTVDVVENPYASPPVIEKNVTYGLVAMHIMYLIDGAPQWVWPTFEHVDNAPLADLRQPTHKITGEWHNPAGVDPQNWGLQPVKSAYSFYNLGSTPAGLLSIGGYSPSSRAAMDAVNAVNTKNGNPDDYYQTVESGTRIPSQIAKVITDNNAIIASKWTYALNEYMRNQLLEIDENSVWANYRLVTTQWPSQPTLTAKWQEYYSKMDPPKALGAGTIRAGNPAPVSLGNSVAETYMQINGSCMNCHSGATLNFKYSSGPFKGTQPDADFSFMLQRAQ